MEPIKMTIKGQPPSKSNLYKIITFHPKKGSGKKPHSSLAKSGDLKKYEELFLLQIPPHYRGLMIEKVMRVEIRCYFRTMSNDLDNAAKGILDCLQHGRVIANDNRVIELEMRKYIDKEEPRAEITIKTLGL
jgi:Holliday junction resolvase RusA-like endonuclease